MKCYETWDFRQPLFIRSSGISEHTSKVRHSYKTKQRIYHEFHNRLMQVYFITKNVITLIKLVITDNIN